MAGHLREMAANRELRIYSIFPPGSNSELLFVFGNSKKRLWIELLALGYERSAN